MSDWFKAWWNGRETRARHVRLRVPEHDPERDPPAAWWSGIEPPEGSELYELLAGADLDGHRDLQGQVVDAVQVDLEGVNHGGGMAFLYDGDGSGYRKVTVARGSPAAGFKQLPNRSEIVEPVRVCTDCGQPWSEHYSADRCPDGGTPWTALAGGTP